MSQVMRIIVVGIVAIISLWIGWQTYSAYQSRFAAGTPYGDPFQLVDHTGQPITQAALRGHPSVVFFGFTHCPEVCPTTLYEMDTWLRTLGDEGRAIRAFFVSVDPERDTPELMNNYVTNVSDRITGITGEPQKVEAMAKSFGIYWKKVPLDGGDYTVDHTASVLMLKPSGDFFGTIAYGENADTAVAKLRRLVAGS